MLQAQGLQQYEVLAQVASKLFGSSESQESTSKPLPQDQVVAQFNDMMG